MECATWPSYIVAVMWVKKTSKEIVEFRKIRNRSSFITVVGMTVFFTLLLGFFPGWKKGQTSPVPLALACKHCVKCILPVFLLVSVVEFFGRGAKTPEVICPKCGTVKYLGEMANCPCGGQFELLAEMKWKE